MNILVAINKKYVRQLNILLNSIGYSNKKEKFNVYILHRNLDKEDMENVIENLDLTRFFIHDISDDRENQN